MGCPRTSPRPCGRRACCAVMGVRRAEPAISAAIGGSRLGEVPPAQEQAGRHPGRLESADRHLRDRSARRCRDLAILLLAFASSGTRRSEVARLRVAQLRDEPPARLDPHDPKSPALPCLAIQLRRTKTGDADEEGRVLLVGPPVGRFTNGWSGPTSRRGRPFRRSTAGKRWKRTRSRRNRSILSLSGVAPWQAWSRRRFRSTAEAIGADPRSPKLRAATVERLRAGSRSAQTRHYRVTPVRSVSPLRRAPPGAAELTAVNSVGSKGLCFSCPALTFCSQKSTCPYSRISL
jgi:hypothetical protein